MLALVSTLLYGEGMTEYKFPTIDLPLIDADKVLELAKDAVYVTVGLGVLAFQKAQVRRQELVKLVHERLGPGKAQYDDLVKALEARINELDEHLDTFETKLDTFVEQAKDRLPEPAGEVLDKAHDAARAARQQVRELIHKAA